MQVAALSERIAVVTERVDAVAERMDAVDEGVKRNSQVKEVCKSKQSFYCRGSRVAEIDQWIADVHKQIANEEDRVDAVFFFFETIIGVLFLFVE